MIGRLVGVLTECDSDGTCVVDVHGVGYEVTVPATTRRALPEPPGPAALYVHTHVREEALSLYGFATLEDRTAFRALLGVSSIGPKSAIAILGHLDSAKIADAVARGDKTAFAGVSGVGKKTIERILIDLRGKLAPRGPGRVPSQSKPDERFVEAGPLSTVVHALVHMGYRQGEAEQAVSRIADQAEGKQTEHLLREALAALAP